MAKQTQLEKFKQASRELETDDDEKRFDEKLGKIAKQKPTGAASLVRGLTGRTSQVIWRTGRAITWMIVRASHDDRKGKCRYVVGL